MSRLLKTFIFTGIIVFWGVMTGWLVRANWNEGNAPFSDMPPLVVFRQMLKHEVSSSLGVYRGRHRIGTATVTPLHSPGTAVNLDGNIAIPQEGGKPQTFNFSLRLDLEPKQLRPENINFRLSRRQPALNALIEVLLKEQKVRYNIKNGEPDLGTQELPLSGNGLLGAMPTMVGLPPLPMAPATLLQSLEIRANRASFAIRGEQVDGFRVRLSAAGLNATATLGQLGEIFVFRTSTEYHLLADGLDPAKYLP